jgi:hypothetical protein
LTHVRQYVMFFAQVERTTMPAAIANEISCLGVLREHKKQCWSCN